MAELPDWTVRDLRLPGWRWLVLTAALPLLARCGGGGGDAVTLPPAELQPVNVHMHLHGHSNHNGAARPASMQWHSSFAEEFAADVLWWTDHNEMFDQQVPGITRFAGAVVDPTTFDAEVSDLSSITDVPVSFRASRLRAEFDVPTPQVSAGADGLRVEFQVDTPGWRWFSYELGAEQGRIKGKVWPRPVGSDLVFTPDVDCPVGPDLRCEIEVILAWKRYSGVQRPQKIVFRRAEQANFVVVSPDEVRVEGPLDSLDLTAALASLRDGTDNNVSRIVFRLGARNGARMSALLRGLRLDSRQPAVANQVEVIRGLAERYATDYGMTQHIGIEAGLRGPHLNIFLPRNADADTVATAGLPAADMVAAIRAQGGLTSYNHLFGTGSSRECPATDSSARVAAVVDNLLANRAFGADLIEIGYLCRGSADLDTHLRTWDTLTANRLLLVGTGVTDTHGNRWSSRMQPNPFSTWVLAESTDRAALLDGLRAGHVYFGNQFLWDGRFELSVGQAAMGEALVTSRATVELSYRLDPLPAGARVYLVQGEFDPADRYAVNYLHAQTDITADPTVAISSAGSSFVRLEVYRDTAGGPPQPLVFSNVILINP